VGGRLSSDVEKLCSTRLTDGKTADPPVKMDLVTEFCVCVTSLICGWHVLRRNDAVKIREIKMLPCVHLIDGPASKLSTLKENF